MGYFCDVMTGPLWRSHYRSGNSFLAKNHGMCLSLGYFWILYTYSACHCNYIAYDIDIRILYIESRLYFINGWNLPNFFPTSGMFGSTFQHEAYAKLHLDRGMSWERATEAQDFLKVFTLETGTQWTRGQMTAECLMKLLEPWREPFHILSLNFFGNFWRFRAAKFHDSECMLCGCSALQVLENKGKGRNIEGFYWYQHSVFWWCAFTPFLLYGSKSLLKFWKVTRELPRKTRLPLTQVPNWSPILWCWLCLVLASVESGLALPWRCQMKRTATEIWIFTGHKGHQNSMVQTSRWESCKTSVSGIGLICIYIYILYVYTLNFVYA